MSRTYSETSAAFNLISAVAAFVLWGCWAYFVNENSVPSSGLVSGITQGAASFLITLLMVRIVTFLFARLPTNGGAILLPALATMCITSSFLIAAHCFVETPNIIRTITPALCVGFVFCIITTLQLRKNMTSLTHECES